MKRFPFNNYLRFPADDNTTDGNGSDPGKTGMDNQDDGDSSVDSNADGSDVELFNRHQRRIGGRTTDGKQAEGTLQKTLEKALSGAGNGNENTKDQKEDSNEEPEGRRKFFDRKDNKEDNTKKEDGDKKEDGNKEEDGAAEDDAILNIDADNLKTASGVPISNAAKDNFNKLRDIAKSSKQELKDLKVKMAQLTENKSTPEDLKKITEERDALAKRIEIQEFETSVGFVETYQKPMDEAKAAVIKFFPKEIDGDDAAKLSIAFKSAHDAAIKGDDAEFYRLVDSIADEMVEGGRSVKNAFAVRMEKYYDSLTAYSKARSDKSEERKLFVDQHMQNLRSKNIKSIESDVDSYASRLLADKSDLLDNIPEDSRKSYVDSVTNSVKTVKSAMSRMAVTGEIPKELSEIIQYGVSAKAILMENKTLSNGYLDANRKMKIMQETIDELKGKAKKISSSSPSKYSSQKSSPESKANDRRHGEGAIEHKLRMQGIS